MYDLVSLGEVMLRMSPPKYIRLRNATQLDVHVAGAQLNVAANLARLGKQTAFISKLPDSELGLLALDTCRSYGVAMDYVKLVPGGRMGVNYLEYSATPRAPINVFDRKNSAASTISPDDFDWDVMLGNTRFAHTDGIFPGISDNCRATTQVYLEAARRHGCQISFDLNYREHLWTEATARECWQKLLPYVDVLVTNRSVSEQVFGVHGSDEDIMRFYHESFGCQVVCLTNREIFGVLKGAWSSIALVKNQVLQGRRYEFDVLDRFGTGDAFLAGFLNGYLERDAAFGLDFGNAACALAHTIEGDVIQFSAAEVAALLSEKPDMRVKR